MPLPTLNALMALRLIIEDDEGTTTIVPLESEAVTIGRQQGNTIQLTEKNVSRRHARLFPESEKWVIEDLNSYNGIKVNGQPIDARISLKEGDVVQIGDYHLALTENVDKRTLNFEGREAANDAAEPLLVSSSTDLPRLSAEELAALQSGPHTPQPSPMLMDSGPVPAVAPAGSYVEERRRGGAGALIGAAAVVVLLATGVLVWLSRDGEGIQDDAVAANSEQPDLEQVAAAAEQQTDELPRGDGAVDPPPTDPDVEPLDADAVEIEEGDPADEPVDVEEVVEAPEDPPAGDPVVEPTPSKPKPRNTRPSKPRNKKPRNDPPASDPQPDPAPPPPEPEVDAAELLADARKAVFKNPRTAYDLARKSYQARRNSDAMALMALAACRMGDSGKAKRAISKLRGKDRDVAMDTCERQGVEI